MTTALNLNSESNTYLMEKIGGYIYECITSHITTYKRLVVGNSFEFSTFDWLDDYEVVAVTKLKRDGVSILAEQLNERLIRDGLDGCLDTYHNTKGLIVVLEIKPF
ncbi:MAG: hypothetical protein ACI88H_003823 [Cocleimonas sp.]|jgi:hypothetical protein